MSVSLSQRPWVTLSLAAVASLATVSLHAQRVAATEPDTIYFGVQRRTEMPNFWIAPLRATLDLKATANRSETSTADGFSSKTSETLFQEDLTLYSNGYIVHPNLVDFHFSITGGLTQGHFSADTVSGDTVSGDTNGTVYGWNVSATILRNQPAPLTLYTRRTESTLDVPFGPTQSTTTTIYGALWVYRTTESYSQFEAFHQEDTQSAFVSNQSELTQTRDVLTGNGNKQLSPNQTLNWSFDLEQANFDNGTSSSDQQIAAGSLSHDITFGNEKRNELASAASYSNSTGELDREDFQWREHLHLYHSPNFETNYDYCYEKLAFGEATTDRHAASMDARHQLYRSLTTVGRLRWENLESEGRSIETYGADLNLNYRKIVPYGVFVADAHAGYEQQDISGSGTFVVVDQPISFVAFDPVRISQTETIPATVIIRDAVTGRTFVPGVDYTTTPTPLGLDINRVIGGSILPGEPLLLSYEYEPVDAREVDTQTYAIGGRYEITKGPLAGLTPYARFFGQDQTISGGTAQANNVQDYVVGAYYQFKELTLRAEREWYESTLYPYDAWRYEARLTHRFSEDTTASAGSTYTDVQYHRPEQQTQTFSINANISYRFTTQLTVSAYGAYVHAESDPGGQTQGIEEGMEANWHFRQTRIYMRLRNSNLDSDLAEQNFQFFQIGLTRFF